MTRKTLLSDEMWARVEPLLPPAKGRWAGRCASIGTWSRARSTATAPAPLGETCQRSSARGRRFWKRRHRFSTDDTWDKVLKALQVQVDARGQIDWRLAVDSTSARVHQHAATASRSVIGATSHTGGTAE